MFLLSFLIFIFWKVCKSGFHIWLIPGSIVCNFVLGLADQHFQSWSYWDTASGGVLWDSEGEPVMDSVKYDYEDI